MPEEMILRCDAPDCDEIGQYETFTCNGKHFEVILGPKHIAVLKELAEWGRPVRGRPSSAKGKRRDTSEARLLNLLDADQK